jgi:ribonucleoside-diphosphate reductase alpha chain
MISFRGLEISILEIGMKNLSRGTQPMNKESNILDTLSEERKAGILNGTVPDWFVTPGYQMFKSKYVWKGTTVKDTYERIAKAAASHTPKPTVWEERFFDLMWNGWLALSSPVLANMGTDRGLPVSCSGSYIGDSIYNFYDAQVEAAMLTKNGFGTSSYLGDIRPRGSDIATSEGNASGITPVLNDFVQLSRDVSQGNTRRGAWAGYINIDHPDFFELVEDLIASPDDKNIGWNISDKFIARLEAGDKDAVERYQRSLKAKCLTGKGYYFFVDRVNRMSPQCYKDHGLEVKASNLCTEIVLHSDKDHTFTCVLSSMNLTKYDEWKETDAVFWATVFLDCVAQEFIDRGSKIRGLEKAVRATEKGRALGLGTLGFHTLLQSKMFSFEGLEAHYLNTEIYKHMDKESLRATKWLAEAYGEPEWCKGYGIHNTHRLAVAPNSSSAMICGGVSQGIEPNVANVFNQPGPAGEITRINPELLKIMKAKNKNNRSVITSIIDNAGSVSHVNWLTDEEKAVFKTAFEINQEVILRLASLRQQYIDQAQSINLFFSADESEEYISKIHQIAFRDKNIKSLYYMRSRAGISASKECESCEG